MQAIDAAEINDALYLGQPDACHGMVGIIVSLRQREEHPCGIVQIILGQEVSGLLLALLVLDDLLWAEGGTAHAVCKGQS